MKLMTITIKAAFLDAPHVTADAIADSLIRDLSDGLYAEVAYTTERTERVVEHPDPDPDSEADVYGPWQETARERLDADEQMSTYEEKTRRREEVSTSENCCANVEARAEYAWEVMRHAEERGHVDDMASVVDVVTNLLHHAEAIGDDGGAVDDLLRVARTHWEAERHGGESHGE